VRTNVSQINTVSIELHKNWNIIEPL